MNEKKSAPAGDQKPKEDVKPTPPDTRTPEQRQEDERWQEIRALVRSIVPAIKVALPKGSQTDAETFAGLCLTVLRKDWADNLLPNDTISNRDRALIWASDFSLRRVFVQAAELDRLKRTLYEAQEALRHFDNGAGVGVDTAAQITQLFFRRIATTDADELAADAATFAQQHLAAIDAAVDALGFDIDLDRATGELDAVMAGLRPGDWSAAARRDLLVGYIGFPLCELVFGRQSLALVTIAAIMTVSVLFAVAIIFVEVGLQTERRAHRLLAKVAKALVRNPLLMAPALGALWSTFDTPVPAAAKVVLHMLGSAASPCALVSLGLFLAARHRGSRSSRPVAATLAALKLVIQPAIVAVCAYGIFKLQPLPAATVVLLSALPTGTGPFMVAEFYKREAVVTSGTILFTTIASVVSLTACLMLIGHAAS